MVAFALGLPEAWEDHPWGETVVKVAKKVFVFFGSPKSSENSRSGGVRSHAVSSDAVTFPSPDTFVADLLSFSYKNEKRLPGLRRKS